MEDQNKDTSLENQEQEPKEKESLYKKVKSFLSGEKKEVKKEAVEQDETAQKNEKKVDKEKDKEKERAKKLPGVFEYFFSNWFNPHVGKSKEEIEKEISQETEKEITEKETRKPLSPFGKVRAIYDEYLKIREKELEKLEIYESIEESARLNKEFTILLISSCIIASFGLIQDSTAVIIGAMLIAPLMLPILGFSLGVIWGDKNLILRSFSILFLGSLLVIGISFALATVLPGVYLTNELSGRINPTLYDIFIALASGVIGAYAYVNPKMTSSLSGVAIAVALMPPLCTVGISLGLGNYQASMGASLLYLTNLIGISLAGSIVFWRLKIHPITESTDEVKERAKRNILVTGFMLIIIAIPLGYFMRETYIIKEDKETVREIIIKEFQDISILELKVKRFAKNYKVKAILFVPQDIDKEKVVRVKKEIRKLFDKKVKIQLMVMESMIEESE